MVQWSSTKILSIQIFGKNNCFYRNLQTLLRFTNFRIHACMDQASKEKTVVSYPRNLEVLTIKSFVFYDCGFHGLNTKAREAHPN